ncbi:hypothetical protein GCM10018773_26660 [Streptomyces candidus]|nr:hypothetical protein GCM10018773_26660 [Streptomyces candidus]
MAVLAPNSVLIRTVRNGSENAPIRLTARATTSSQTILGMSPPRTPRGPPPRCITVEPGIVGYETQAWNLNPKE